MKEIKSYKIFLVLNCVIVALYAAYMLYIYSRFKCKIDKSAQITMIVYLFTFIVKGANWIIQPLIEENIHYDDMIMPDIFCTYVINLLMYYFAFEMRIVWIKSESSSFEECNEKIK